VYIIDEVHMLSTSAFNALLKTLEEPPPNTVFIFATTELHKLPLTVLSRCQRFDFQRLTPAEIESSLARVSEAEGVSIESRTLSLIARRADGGMRDAQSLLDQVLSFSDKEVKHEDVVDALGLVEQELVHALLDMIRTKDAAGAFRLSRDLSNSGADLPEYLLQVAESLRQLLLLTLEPGGSLSDLPSDQLEPLRPFVDTFSEADLLRMMHFIATSLEALKRGGQQRLRFELTLLRLVRLEQSVEVEALLKGLAGLPMEALGDLEEKKTPRLKQGPTKVAAPVAPVASAAPKNTMLTPPKKVAPQVSKSIKPAVTQRAAPQFSKGTKPAAAPQASKSSSSATPPIGSKSMKAIQTAWPRVLDAVQENFPFLALSFQNFLPVLLDDGGLQLKGLYDSALGRSKLERDAPALETLICEILELAPSTRVHYIEAALDDAERFMRPQSTHLDGESRMAELKREQPVVRDLFDRVDGRLLR
jgi:DNA polymerase III subunit gamma/tau